MDKAIELARECGDVEVDRRGRETFTFDNHGIERFYKLAQAAALREAAKKFAFDCDCGLEIALRRMAEEKEKK